LRSTKRRFDSGAEGRFLVKVRRLLLLLAYKRRRIKKYPKIAYLKHCKNYDVRRR